MGTLRSLFQEEAREGENPVKRKGAKGLNFKVYAENISPLLTGLHIWNYMFIEFRLAWTFVPLRAFGIWWVNDQSPEQGLLQEGKEKPQQPPYGKETEQLKVSSANEMEGEAIFTAVTLCQGTRLTTKSNWQNIKQMQTFLCKWSCKHKGSFIYQWVLIMRTGLSRYKAGGLCPCSG